MNQQAPDVPRSVQIIGRYRTLIGLLAALGLIAGIVIAALFTSAATSTESVVFSAPSCPGGAGAICGGPAFSPAIFQSTVLEAFPSGVQITSVTGDGDVLTITVTGDTTAQAAATAWSVVGDFNAHIGSLSYMGENPSVQVLKPVTTASRTVPPGRLLSGALLGVLAGALLGVIVALAGARTTIDPLPAPRGLAVGNGEDPAPWRFGPEWK